MPVPLPLFDAPSQKIPVLSSRGVPAAMASRLLHVVSRLPLKTSSAASAPVWSSRLPDAVSAGRSVPSVPESGDFAGEMKTALSSSSATHTGSCTVGSGGSPVSSLVASAGGLFRGLGRKPKTRKKTTAATAGSRVVSLRGRVS